MRQVIMFTDMPSEHSASAHVNGAQFVPWFRSQGWELKLFPPLPWKFCWWLSGRKGFARLMWYGVLPLQRFFEVIFQMGNAHVVIVHKCVTTMCKKPIFEKLIRRLHKTIIFNFDDAVYEKGVPYVPDRISLADAVWVGNPILFAYSKQYCHQVKLIEAAIDCSHYRAKSNYEAHDPLQLIWSGSPSSHQYLEQLREPLKTLSERRRFVLKIVSGVRFSFNDPDIVDEWVPYEASSEVDCLTDSDIALMPVPDGPYERAKENFKVKMYMACGLPLICSRVGVNLQFVKDGERGFFAETSEDWVRLIEQLANSRTLREQIGRTARQYTVAKYDIPVIGPQLLGFIEGVARNENARHSPD